MPHWGLYPLWVMLVATPLLLAAGWWQRRHGGTRRGVSRACVIIGAMQIAWTILLLWSFVAGQAQISGQAMPADGGQFFELLLAAAAALAALILVRDSRQRRTGELIVAESKSPMEDTPDDTSAGEL